MHLKLPRCRKKQLQKQEKLIKSKELVLKVNFGTVQEHGGEKLKERGTKEGINKKDMYFEGE